MKPILLCAALVSLAVLTLAQPKLPKRPGFGAGGSLLRLEPDYTGREAMRVDGKRVSVLERQKDGTYLLRYSDKEADRVSINEVVLMPKGER